MQLEKSLRSREDPAPPKIKTTTTTTKPQQRDNNVTADFSLAKV